MIGDGVEKIGGYSPITQLGVTPGQERKIDPPPRNPNGFPNEQYTGTCANLKIKIPNISDQPNYITPESFCYWFQGFAELSGQCPTVEQWEIIKAHLALVFDKRTQICTPDLLDKLNLSLTPGKSNLVC